MRGAVSRLESEPQQTRPRRACGQAASKPEELARKMDEVEFRFEAALTKSALAGEARGHT